MTRELVPLISKKYILTIRKMSGYAPVMLSGKVLLFDTSEEAIKYRDQRKWLKNYKVMYEMEEVINETSSNR